MKDQGITSFLADARLRIENGQKTPKIRSLLAGRGYDEATFQQGVDLLESATDAQEKQELEQAEAVDATHAKDLVLAEVSQVYDREKPILKVLLKDDLVAQRKLGLNAAKRKTQPARIKQIKDLFVGLQSNEEWKQKAATRGLTAEVIDESAAKITEVDSLIAKQSKEQGEAQQATKDRNKIFSDLEDWLEEYEATARAALYDQPQLLEMLGIFVRS